MKPPGSKERAWWLRMTDRRIVAAGLSVVAALIGLVRSLIDLHNHR